MAASAAHTLGHSGTGSHAAAGGLIQPPRTVLLKSLRVLGFSVRLSLRGSASHGQEDSLHKSPHSTEGHVPRGTRKQAALAWRVPPLAWTPQALAPSRPPVSCTESVFCAAQSWVRGVCGRAGSGPGAAVGHVAGMQAAETLGVPSSKQGQWPGAGSGPSVRLKSAGGPCTETPCNRFHDSRHL